MLCLQLCKRNQSKYWCVQMTFLMVFGEMILHFSKNYSFFAIVKNSLQTFVPHWMPQYLLEIFKLIASFREPTSLKPKPFMNQSLLAVLYQVTSKLHIITIINTYKLLYRPLMISTQKLSDLAFSVHDGMQKKEEQLNPSQRNYALK